jgi:type IV secretory pathway protease TraF
LLVWNVSESVPVGLYRVHPVGKLVVNDLVIAIPPEPLATYLDHGGYLPRAVPLIKPVLAVPGQTVCRAGFNTFVDGIEIGTARKRDARGRWLLDWGWLGIATPVPTACRCRLNLHALTLLAATRSAGMCQNRTLNTSLSF